MPKHSARRFLLEVLFLAGVAAALTYAELRPAAVIALMAIAWVVVALLEWTAWLGRAPLRTRAPAAVLRPARRASAAARRRAGRGGLSGSARVRRRADLRRLDPGVGGGPRRVAGAGDTVGAAGEDDGRPSRSRRRSRRSRRPSPPSSYCRRRTRRGFRASGASSRRSKPPRSSQRSSSPSRPRPCAQAGAQAGARARPRRPRPGLGHGAPPRRAAGLDRAPAVPPAARRRRGRGRRGRGRPAARPRPPEPRARGDSEETAMRRPLAQRQVILAAVALLAAAVSVAFTARHDHHRSVSEPAAVARLVHGPRGRERRGGARPEELLRRDHRRQDHGHREPGAPMWGPALSRLPRPSRARLGDRPGRRSRRRARPHLCPRPPPRRQRRQAGPLELRGDVSRSATVARLECPIPCATPRIHVEPTRRVRELVSGG